MAKKYKLPKIDELFEAGVHFGHQVRRWNPKMEPYIYGYRSGVHVIDLAKTLEFLEKAADHMYEVASEGGQIIFLGTKKQAKDIVDLEAKRCGAMFVKSRWLGGTITNFSVIRKNIKKLLDYIKKRDAGEFDIYTKKEQLLLDREIEKLNDLVGGIAGLKGKPDALFVIDAKRESTAIREANIYDIPVTAVVDTNADPKNIDYIIPGNDDAIRSIAIITKVIADAVEAGYKDYEEKKIKKTQEEEKEKKAKKKKEEDGERKKEEERKEKEKKEKSFKDKEDKDTTKKDKKDGKGRKEN